MFSEAKMPALVLIATAVLLAALALVKFVVVKPIFFLLLALLYVVGAYLVAKRLSRGVVLFLGVLNLAVALFLGRYIVANGFDVDAYENGTDFVVVLLGTPLALAGLGAAVAYLRTARTRERLAV